MVVCVGVLRCGLVFVADGFVGLGWFCERFCCFVGDCLLKALLWFTVALGCGCRDCCLFPLLWLLFVVLVLCCCYWFRLSNYGLLRLLPRGC